MATVVQTIKGALVNKLNGVGNINGVYKYEIATPTNGQYPYATVIVREGEARFGDTIRNLRHHRFEVNLYQERTATGQGNQQAEVIVDQMIDEITTAFDADTTLSGSVLWARPVSFNTKYESREIGDMRFCQFIIETESLVPST